MTTLVRLLVAILMLAGIAPCAAAQDDRSARAIVESAIEAHGGELFLNPGTLQLRGTAIFYDPATGAVRSRVDDYRMWREFSEDRLVAHGAEGKVRIIATNENVSLFEVGYDGETTWTQDGVMPRDEADAYWANNFGFGIIRSALNDRFVLQTGPQRRIGGRETHIVRIIDPQGQETLFGVDADSHFLTYMAFRSPRGFHERLYGDFIKLENGWVQARSVSLLYDGVLSNTVFWEHAVVGEPIDPVIFTPPSE
ncbi:hypothetical protein [Aurantiacibacter aquimixticola]|uniref:Outer membrane lipoprotein-sorting protein n=1 Tax=Aurantiacibacter aquimixticola TaxID=1958945 RepID=A0A419RW82_9SPHN|nr:hypothetical protein [Aurantiacibacter aquimixticola]RJY10060.1 hypothetical protein D6201_12470 [Aurantiacibacter aquimixticola]